MSGDLRALVADEVRKQLDREALDRRDEARLGAPRGSIVRDGDPKIRLMYPTPAAATALPPDDAIAAIRQRLDDGGHAFDLATSDVRALLAAYDRLAEIVAAVQRAVTR